MGMFRKRAVDKYNDVLKSYRDKIEQLNDVIGASEEEILACGAELIKAQELFKEQQVSFEASKKRLEEESEELKEVIKNATANIKMFSSVVSPNPRGSENSNKTLKQNLKANL